MINDTDLPEAEVRVSSRTSAIWILPIIALSIAGWLFWQSLMESPIDIRVDFPSGSGIEVGKTKVLYEGIVAGVVADMQLDMRDLKGVQVKVSIDHRMEALLRESTEFWLVKPEISLKGVTGLETIVTGNYIAIKPGQEGKRATVFQALAEPPSYDVGQPGLNITLRAQNLGSIRKNSSVLFKQLQVGTVVGYSLTKNSDEVLIRINIKPEYAALVRADTRFWNISGLRAKAGFDGVEVSTDSLVALIQGGITFDSPSLNNQEATNNPVVNGAEFLLFADAKAAQRSVPIVIRFPAPLEFGSKDTKILFKGFEVGSITNVELDKDNQFVVAQANINPEAEPLLTTNTQFWVVKPQVSLEGVKGLDLLLSGPYVELDYQPGEAYGDGYPEFVALTQPPAVTTRDPGLQLTLTAESMDSVRRGSPVFYRQVAVGRVNDVRLRSQRDGVDATITIDEPYRELVTESSRFWNASGISLAGSFSGLKVDIQSLLSVIKGGVAFYNPANEAQAKPVTEGAHFPLYDSRELAQEHGIMVRLLAQSADGIQPGTLIKFQGFPIGEVKSIELIPDLSGVLIQAVLRERGRKFATQGSRFWLVKPSFGLTGTENLDTLVKGPHFEVSPGSGPAQYEFAVLNKAPTKGNPGVNIVLKAARLNSIREGVKIHYRDVVVGEVTGFRLAEDAQAVLINATIYEPYNRLVREGTQFWNASGVNVDFGLFKGAEIRTESLEYIIQGGISFATPEAGDSLPLAQQNSLFRLHNEVKDEWLKWAPQIKLP